MNFYDSIIEGAQELPPAERGQLYAACLEYLYYGREPEFALKPVVRGMFIMVRPVMDSQIKKSEAGSKGGRARVANAKQSTKQNASTPASKGQADAQANAKQSAKQNATEQEQEKEIEKETPSGVKKKTQAPFKRPTVEEVAEYAASQGYAAFDAQHFVDYYESNGWKVGRNPMKDWRATVRNWARNDDKKGVHHVSAYSY